MVKAWGVSPVGSVRMNAPGAKAACCKVYNIIISNNAMHILTETDKIPRQGSRPTKSNNYYRKHYMVTEYTCCTDQARRLTS